MQAAKGERMAGIGFDMRGAREKTQGAPIDIVLPKEGAGWELEATAIVKGTKNLDARQEGRRLGRQQGRERALLEVLRDRRRAEREEHAAELSADAEQAMVKNDFGWMAENRDRILAEWSKRYEFKSAPKN